MYGFYYVAGALPLAGADSAVSVWFIPIRSANNVWRCIHEQRRLTERIPNGHGFNILHIKGIAGELNGARITQNEMQSGEEYSNWKEVLTE